MIPTCQQITELVTDYLEGELSWSTWIRFQLHLGLCHVCRTYLRQMKRTIEMTGELPPIEPPESVRAELMERFQDWSN